jgi:RNA polymerase sigma-70 factor, ECF subfamily
VVNTERLPKNQATEDSDRGNEGAPQTGATLDVRATWSESEFESFFLSNYSRVVALLLRIVGDPARAEEIADDAFLKLYRQRLSSDRDHNLKAWLYRTASRMGIDALRAASRRARIESAAAAEAECTHSNSPLGGLIQSEEQLQVRRVLARLRPAEARILVLRSSGFSYKEIAAAFGIRPGSVGTLLNRAESAFEKAFGELFNAATARRSAPEDKRQTE